MPAPGCDELLVRSVWLDSQEGLAASNGSGEELKNRSPLIERYFCELNPFDCTTTS
jgi:hypothetical protein